MHTQTKGIDCAVPLTGEKVAALKALGYDFAGRYFCPAGNWKRLNRDEALAITGAGMKILSVYETTANRAKGGASTGTIDGQRAYKQACELNMPTSGIIYFAVDYDAQPAEFDAVEAYLRAARAQTGPYEIGVYGSFKVVEAMKTRGACKAFWQCVAWSYGKISAHHNVYQEEWNIKVAEHTVDINSCTDMVAAGIWSYEEEDMSSTDENYEVFKNLMERYEKETRALPPSEYAEVSCRKSVESGVFSDGNHDGSVDEPQGYVKRQELATVLHRLGLI